MAEKSRGQLRFGRKFDGIDRSDSNFNLKRFSAPLGFENNVFKKFSARAAGTKFVGEIYCGATLPPPLDVAADPAGQDVIIPVFSKAKLILDFGTLILAY